MLAPLQERFGRVNRALSPDRPIENIHDPGELAIADHAIPIDVRRTHRSAAARKVA